ncbi:MAG: CCA tRNA nucleotidyltransferase [Thermoguttaceae bacterium]
MPDEQRRFALGVVRRLREAGFEAYWAGGCVRDELLGRVPKDFDVATSATPRQIRDRFGRRTLAIGAAFGVMTVRGPEQAGMIEVATFRRDSATSDGRRPDHVTFSSAREDALRRDFTINGLFYDPLQGQVIDFVGGQEDLARRVVRAIGPPRDRFTEDKLRLLRAVRFAATLDFVLESETAAALGEMAGQITVVSPERIAMEMRRMLVDPGRARGIRLLVDLGLAEAVLPEIVPRDEAGRAPSATMPRMVPGSRLDRALAVLERLREPSFPLALAALLGAAADAPPDATADARRVGDLGLRWRLANREVDEAAWLVEHRESLRGASAAPWSRVQPLVVHPWIDDLAALHEADSPEGAEAAAWCRTLLEQPRERLDPPPLATGDDLVARGIPAGPIYKTLLDRLRGAQLDGEVHTRDEALALADRLLQMEDLT